MNYLLNLNPVYQALIATTFTFLVTSLGSLIVIFFKNVKKTTMDIMLSISAGIMLAASFFSLLLPSIETAEKLNMIPWLVSTIGLLFGGILILVFSKFFERKLKDSKIKSNFMLIFSITLHNIPEGLAVGVAFGSIKYGGATFASACLLALGIAIQNFPEGSAVSLPLRRSGISRGKSFVGGSLSAIVEPISGVIGALLVLKVQYMLPILLAFAAGAMIYVAVEELIPESQTNKNKDLMSLFTIIGFAIMMVLDVALG